jgi:MFS family permease
MSRLLVIVSAVVFVDTALFGAIVPLIPGFADSYGLSKTQAGLLVGVYGAGVLVGGIPGGALAARIGSKRAVVLGLSALAISSVGFALAGSPLALGVARLAQGMSSAVTWAGALAWLAAVTPVARRGRVLGTAFSAAVVGFVCGPFIGGVAGLVSIRWTFVAAAAIAAALAVGAWSQAAARAEGRDLGAVRRALADRAFLLGLWLSLLPALLFGMIDVLVPLALDTAGYGVAAVAAVFVVAGLTEAAVNPVAGAIADRHGRLLPIRVGLVASIAVAVLLAVAPEPPTVIALVILAAIAFGGFYAPGISLVSVRADVARLNQSFGFGVMNTAWATGALLGPLLGGVLDDALGEPAPYLLGAVLCAMTFLALAVAVPRPVQPA